MPVHALALITSILAAASVAAADPKPSPAGVEFFESKVRPILVQHCYSCHSSHAKKLKGELRLDTSITTRKGGATGPAVVPGDLAKSLLVRAVRRTDESMAMPPDKPLTKTQIADLEAWVRMGAPDPRDGETTATTTPELWSLKPLQEPPVPAIRNAAWPLNPVDKFILAKLEAKGLTPAAPADKRTLIRRATFDLTGLPPTSEEIHAFLADSSPHAFTTVVERLLASPAYGERWGRHWLDVARYADTAGDNSDYPIPQMYRYRNWVIDAVRRDLPYDEFVRQQLAGDLMPAKNEADRTAKIVATGYLANSRRFGSYEDERYPWYLTYEDTIDNLGKTFLGLTVGCARCHDHKFDPITQKDYYALYGFFSSTRYPRPGIELDKVQRDFVPLASAEMITTLQAERDRKLAEFDAIVNKLEDERKSTDKELTAAEKLTNGDQKSARVSELNKKMDRLKSQVRKARTEREAAGKKPLPFDTAYAVAEGKTEGKKKVGNACVQIKGDPERLGPEVPRRFPTVLGGQSLSPDVKGSGRLELANWIVHPKNPLTARVMVNRVWHYHFGKGIVPTPGNFGTLGQPPTHPELLDWLTTRFIQSGWSLKAMHRLVMSSRTYQMSSADNADNSRTDVNNEWLWRFDRQRLDAESIRDAMLAVAGNLDRSTEGPHPFPNPTTWNFTQHEPFKAVYESNRRSVYLMTQRIQRHPYLALFDGPDTNAGSYARVTSTTPLQALYFMNDPFVHAQAKSFGNRIFAGPGDDRTRVQQAYTLLFGRLPSEAEMRAAADYLGRVRTKVGGDAAKAWESLARVLFLSNEFVYVD